MTEKLKVTSADEYAAMPEKELEGEPYEMPSGAVWLIARADVADLAFVGELPMSLVSAAMGTKAKQQNVDIEGETPTEDGEVDEQFAVAREITRAHVIQPRLAFGDKGDKGKLGVVDSAGVWHKLKRGDGLFAWKVISGQEGNDGLERFPNRAERRALAAQSRRGKVQPRPVPAQDEGRSATA